MARLHAPMRTVGALLPALLTAAGGLLEAALAVLVTHLLALVAAGQFFCTHFATGRAQGAAVDLVDGGGAAIARLIHHLQTRWAAAEVTLQSALVPTLLLLTARLVASRLHRPAKHWRVLLY